MANQNSVNEMRECTLMAMEVRSDHLCHATPAEVEQSFEQQLLNMSWVEKFNAVEQLKTNGEHFRQYAKEKKILEDSLFDKEQEIAETKTLLTKKIEDLDYLDYLDCPREADKKQFTKRRKLEHNGDNLAYLFAKLDELRSQRNSFQDSMLEARRELVELRVEFQKYRRRTERKMTKISDVLESSKQQHEDSGTEGEFDGEGRWN